MTRVRHQAYSRQGSAHFGQDHQQVPQFRDKKASAFHVTGLTSALNGEREGNLGVDLDKSKRLHERIKYYEDKRQAKLEAQKKQIAETHENGDNGEDIVAALPSEQVEESHAAYSQTGKTIDLQCCLICPKSVPLRLSRNVCDTAVS